MEINWIEYSRQRNYEFCCNYVFVVFFDHYWNVRKIVGFATWEGVCFAVFMLFHRRLEESSLAVRWSCATHEGRTEEATDACFAFESRDSPLRILLQTLPQTLKVVTPLNSPSKSRRSCLSSGKTIVTVATRTRRNFIWINRRHEALLFFAFFFYGLARSDFWLIFLLHTRILHCIRNYPPLCFKYKIIPRTEAQFFIENFKTFHDLFIHFCLLIFWHSLCNRWTA